MFIVKIGDIKTLKSRIIVNINRQTSNGRTLLHYAVEYGHCDIILYFLSMEADVNIADKYGITPLLVAILEDQTDAAQILIEHGAVAAGRCPDGRSYFEVAISDEMKRLLS